MRFARFLALASVLAAASGCAPSAPLSPAERLKANEAELKSGVNAPNVSTATSFRFSGKNSRQKACSTGLHTFSSQKQMCIAIQDPAQNADCAIDKRAEKFQKECAPKFVWEESITCHFALLDPAAKISSAGTYDSKYVKEAGDLCAGRTPGGLDETGTVATGVTLIDDILYDVDLAFVPTNGAGVVPGQSHFKMSIYRKDATGKKTSLAPDFEFDAGSKIASGKLDGANYEYVLRCTNTWACPGSAD